MKFKSETLKQLIVKSVYIVPPEDTHYLNSYKMRNDNKKVLKVFFIITYSYFYKK